METATKKLPRKLSEKLIQCILTALRMAGTCDPEQCLPFVEEQLTAPEAETMQAFLGHCHETGRTFGHGTIEGEYARFLARTERAPKSAGMRG